MREQGLPAIPVTDDGKIIGAVTERDVVQWIGAGFDAYAPINSLPLTQLPMLYAGASAAEALRVFESERVPCLLVVDQQMTLIGVLTPSRLMPEVPRGLRPPLVGGMATPLGVYLTNGAQSGGVGPLALGLAGALMGLFHLGGVLAFEGIAQPLFRWGWPASALEALVSVGSLLFFLVAIRLHPMAGYHAAEHMVVHAIERGELLEPEIVRRMPRVHPRCGTNLAVGMGLFFGISMSEWTPDLQFRILVAAIVTLFLWRPLGSMVQFWLTTRPPNRRQLDAGIRAGRELLEKYEQDPILAPGVGSRLLRSGLPWILIGYLLLATAVDFVLRLLNLGGLLQV